MRASFLDLTRAEMGALAGELENGRRLAERHGLGSALWGELNGLAQWARALWLSAPANGGPGAVRPWWAAR